jgi:septal ring factor EnvC (AmiA/AmiB activator)
MAALGSEQASLKGDADHGSVTLELAGETYARELTRTNGDVSFTGEPYVEEPQRADLFAFLLESNPARRAVVRDDDLRELILRPVDVETIEAQISQLQAEKRSVDEQRSELSEAERERDSLDEEHARVANQLEHTETELTEARDSLASLQETDSESTGSEQLDSLRETQSQLEDVTYDLETEQESVASLKAEQTELTEELGELAAVDEEELDELASQIEQIRGQKRELDEIISQLQTVIQFNEQLTEDGVSDLLDDLDDEQATTDTEPDSGALTDQLLADQSATVTCWTCGSQVDTDQIDATVTRLQELRHEKVERRNELDRKLEERKTTRNEYTTTRDRRAELERALETTEAELADRTDRIADLESQREDLLAEIETLESAVEADEDDEELLAAQKDVTQLELERDRLERQRDALADDIADLDSQLDEQEQLETRREEITAELEELRTRIERLEREAIGAFNEQMETVVELLDYENLTRIWLEYRKPESRDDATFDLHVTRRTEDGTTYEDSVAHLSESEREVTGLVLALAGYLVHEVHEAVPFMLLDSLEAIDAERIAQLIEYLEQYASYVVVALLPEDASALDPEYQRITEL